MKRGSKPSRREEPDHVFLRCSFHVHTLQLKTSCLLSFFFFKFKTFLSLSPPNRFGKTMLGKNLAFTIRLVISLPPDLDAVDRRQCEDPQDLEPKNICKVLMHRMNCDQ